MKKVIETLLDGRVVVRQALEKPKRIPPVLRGFRILFAYGEKCLVNPNMLKDHNLTILGIVADAEQPFVGYFTEVFE